MLPISDVTVHQRRKPYVNATLIVLNAIVFVYSVTLSDLDIFRSNYKYGVVPAELAVWRVLEGVRLLMPGGPVNVDIASLISAWGTVFTSMFMHGGWMHFISNMLFLWVPGDNNVEYRLGHVEYLLLYLGCSIVAGPAWSQRWTPRSRSSAPAGPSRACCALITIHTTVSRPSYSCSSLP